jgi:hypothetical protein
MPELFFDHMEADGRVVKKINLRALSTDEVFKRIEAISPRERKGRVRRGVKY